MNLQSIHLIYWEENRVADSLANEAYQFSVWQAFFSYQDLSLGLENVFFSIELACRPSGVSVISDTLFPCRPTRLFKEALTFLSLE